MTVERTGGGHLRTFRAARHLFPRQLTRSLGRFRTGRSGAGVAVSGFERPKAPASGVRYDRSERTAVSRRPRLVADLRHRARTKSCSRPLGTDGREGMVQRDQRGRGAATVPHSSRRGVDDEPLSGRQRSSTAQPSATSFKRRRCSSGTAAPRTMNTAMAAATSPPASRGNVQSVAGAWSWSAPRGRWMARADVSMVRRPGNFSYIHAWLTTAGIGRQLTPQRPLHGRAAVRSSREPRVRGVPPDTRRSPRRPSSGPRSGVNARNPCPNSEVNRIDDADEAAHRHSARR